MIRIPECYLETRRPNTFNIGGSKVEVGVRLIGEIWIGEGGYIGAPGEINAWQSCVSIGDGCDIAGGVTIHTGDSHLKCQGFSDKVERIPIIVGNRVFIGANAIILGGCTISDGAVIPAGAVVPKNTYVAPGATYRK